MKLAEIERLQYKGSVELDDDGDVSHSVDIFYNPSTKAVYQVIRGLNKWREVIQDETAKQKFYDADWNDFE